MDIESITTMLRRSVFDGPGIPIGPECLSIQRMLAILDSPASILPTELNHLTDCGFCRRAMALAKRERTLIDGTLDEEDAIGQREETSAKSFTDRGSAARWWSTRMRSLMAAAAVIVVAVGADLWFRIGGSNTGSQLAIPGTSLGLLDPLSGEFESNEVRGDGPKELRYNVRTSIQKPAYTAIVYLDSHGVLSVSESSPQKAGAFEFPITVTNDPPGRQWVAVVASESALDVRPLQRELSKCIEGLDGSPNGLSQKIDALNATLQKQAGVIVQQLQFEIPK